MIYCDTSFLGSLYISDANSPQALDALQGINVAIDFSLICEIELNNAIQLAVFRKQIDTKRASQAQVDIVSDQRSGFLAAPSVSVRDAFALAVEISAEHTAATGNRTMDILHIAFALTGKRQRFYTFDKRQARLAATLGLEVSP